MSDLFAEHAETYAAVTEHSGPNAHYDRPAILRLAGELAGRRVLELGCASGVLTEQLVERGADVLALDREPRLVALARERLAHQPPGRGRAQVEVADIGRPLDVASASVDLVVASLVLHFLADWAPLLGELHRCLKPRGALVFSVHHPFTGWLLSDQTDYHRTELVSEEWDWGERRVTARMYRRPLSAIFGQLRAAGFTVDAVDEPRPRPDAPLDPALHQILDTKPVFLFVRALRSQVG